jgi:hypothetical protein
MAGGAGLALGIGGIAGGSALGGTSGSILGAAGTGALIGSFFGPEGAALGAAGGAIYASVKALNALPKTSGTVLQGITSDFKNSTVAVNAFARATRSSGAALKANTTAVADALVKGTGLGKSARQVGLTQKDLTNAITQGGAAYKQVSDVLKSGGPWLEFSAKQLAQLRREYVAGKAAAITNALATGRVLGQYNKTVTAANLLTGAQFRVGTATKNAAGTARDFDAALRAVSLSVVSNGTSLDRDTSFGQANAVALQNAARASLRHAQAVTARTGSVKAGVKALETDRRRLIETATQSGLSAKAAGELADKIFGIPETWNSKITANTAAAKTKVEDLRSSISSLIDFITNAKPTLNVGTRVENLPPMLIGSYNGTPGVSTNANTGVAPTRNSRYGPSMLDMGYGPRASRPSAASKASGAAGATTGTSKGARKIAGTPAPSAEDAAQAAQERSDLRSAARSAGAALRAVGRNATSSAADLRSAGVDFLRAGRAAGLSASQMARLRSTERQMVSAGRARDRIAARLGTAPTGPTAYDRLATARGNFKDARSAVKSAFTSSFDITTAGQNQYGYAVSFRAIKRQLDKAVANAKRFTSVLRRLGKLGLNKVLLQQLADAGPSALPQALALVSATPKQLAALNSDARTLNALGDKAGTRVANSMYGAGLKSAEGLVRGLLSQESALNSAIKRLADGMVATLRSELDMHSPSRRLYKEAALGWKGYANGVESQQKTVEAAARGVVNASVVPGRGGITLGAAPGGATIHELHLHYPVPETVDRGLATAIRNARSGLGR